MNIFSLLLLLLTLQFLTQLPRRMQLLLDWKIATGTSSLCLLRIEGP